MAGKKNRIRLWRLLWNKENIPGCIGVSYAVCKAKQNQLINAGTHSKHLFKILPFFSIDIKQ